MIDTLIEVIFRGSSSNINLIFLEKWLIDPEKMRFNEDVNLRFRTVAEIIKYIQSTTYTDIAFTIESLIMRDKIVKNIFINLGKDGDRFDLLLYFDLKYLQDDSLKSAVDSLIIWTQNFASTYGLKDFVCQIENACDGEYYFDNNGYGPLYMEEKSDETF